MKKIYLSLGSNLGDRISNIYSGINFMKKKGIRPLRISPFYITEPMYYLSQPYFINCAVLAKSPFSPEKTLELCQAAERQLKRRRVIEKGPRTLDVDIIYFENLIVNKKKLVIPHPCRLERAFVMVPMADISPLKKDPCSGKTILQIKNGLASNEVLRLPRGPEEMEAFLTALKPKKSSSYGTDPIVKALYSLGQPHKKMGRVIHVTGSNGKTSVSSFCAALSMKALRLKTGLYTSPHISSLTERIQINGEKISMKELFKAVIAVASKAPYPLSYFETMTAAAFLVFSQKRTEAVVIETGLGGARDATNAVNGNVCVFTPVTTEHRDIIGPELSDICLEKAGIIKKGSIAVSSFRNTGIPEEIFKREAVKKGAFFLRSQKIEDDGKWQEENIELASEAVSAFSGIEKLKLLSYAGHIKKYSPPARYEEMRYGNHSIIFDGAHNPHAFRKLLAGRKFGCALVSFLSDKDAAGCLAELERCCKNIIISSCSSYRALEPEKIFKAAADKRKYTVEKKLTLAVKKAFSVDKSVLVTGSLYFCSDVKAVIEKRKISHPREMIEKS